MNTREVEEQAILDFVMSNREKWEDLTFLAEAKNMILSYEKNYDDGGDFYVTCFINAVNSLIRRWPSDLKQNEFPHRFVAYLDKNKLKATVENLMTFNSLLNEEIMDEVKKEMETMSEEEKEEIHNSYLQFQVKLRNRLGICSH